MILGNYSNNSSSLISGAIKSSKESADSAKVTADSSASASALTSLSGNFNQFLTLLTTQLQHQDPSNPTSADSFTSEIAQFAGVQQQAETNTKMDSLISATQSNEMTSALGLIGKKTTASSSILPLQDGQASLSYNAPQSGQVAIAITNSGGTVVKTDLVVANAGDNKWTWDGVSSDGNKLQDGQYNVGIEAASGNSSVSIKPSVNGVITGISKNNSSVRVNLGNSEIDMSDLSNFTES